eukprot:1179868-Prorocentrum_minimum.AAC.3
MAARSCLSTRLQLLARTTFLSRADRSSPVHQCPRGKSAVEANIRSRSRQQFPCQPALRLSAEPRSIHKLKLPPPQAARYSVMAATDEVIGVTLVTTQVRNCVCPT